MKKWSSQWTQFMQLRKEGLKKIQDFNGVWTRGLAFTGAMYYQLTPVTLGAGRLWVHMFPWKKWVLMIYEINDIWTAEMKWKWRNDRRSQTQFMQFRKEAFHGNIWTHNWPAPNVSGFIAHLVEHRTGNREVTGSSSSSSSSSSFISLFLQQI